MRCEAGYAMNDTSNGNTKEAAATGHKEQNRREHQRYRWIWWLIVGGGVILLPLGAYRGYRRALVLRVAARLDAVREAGSPATLEELGAWYDEHKGGENAADTYLKAFSLFADPPDAEEGVLFGLFFRIGEPPYGEPLADETKATVAQHLARSKEALALLHRGAAVERCHFPLDFSQGINYTPRHLIHIREGCQLLSFEAVLSADDGDSQKAAQAVFACLRLAGSLSDEPVLISYLCQIADNCIACETLEDVLNRTDLSDAHLRRITKVLSEADDPDRTFHAIMGERCLIVDFFERRFYNDPALGVAQEIPPFYVLSGREDRELAFCLDVLRDYLEALREPIPKRVRSVQAIDRQVDEARNSLGYVMPEPLLKATVHYWRRYFANRARLRTALAAVAVERYRLVNGELPDKLRHLVPQYLDAVPVDPFDGKLLRYRKLKKGFIVYSIGKNLKDDAGSEDQLGGDIGTADMIFRIER